MCSDKLSKAPDEPDNEADHETLQYNIINIV